MALLSGVVQMDKSYRKSHGSGLRRLGMMNGAQPMAAKTKTKRHQ
jgi:hypothetical protein